ncbi:MAG: hypothetical protein AAF799_37660 [Myxococcota bacterium]
MTHQPLPPSLRFRALVPALTVAALVAMTGACDVTDEIEIVEDDDVEMRKGPPILASTAECAAMSWRGNRQSAHCWAGGAVDEFDTIGRPGAGDFVFATAHHGPLPLGQTVSVVAYDHSSNSFSVVANGSGHPGHPTASNQIARHVSANPAADGTFVTCGGDTQGSGLAIAQHWTYDDATSSLQMDWQTTVPGTSFATDCAYAPNGDDIWMATGSSVVRLDAASGAQAATYTTGMAGIPTHLAFDGSGSIYAAGWGLHAAGTQLWLSEFDPSTGAFASVYSYAEGHDDFLDDLVMVDTANTAGVSVLRVAMVARRDLGGGNHEARVVIADLDGPSPTTIFEDGGWPVSSIRVDADEDADVYVMTQEQTGGTVTLSKYTGEVGLSPTRIMNRHPISGATPMAFPELVVEDGFGGYAGLRKVFFGGSMSNTFWGASAAQTHDPFLAHFDQQICTACRGGGGILGNRVSAPLNGICY